MAYKNKNFIFKNIKEYQNCYELFSLPIVEFHHQQIKMKFAAHTSGPCNGSETMKSFQINLSIQQNLFNNVNNYQSATFKTS